MSLKDTPTGYGWISIALHWITAALILVLLFLGNTIDTAAGADRTAALVKHTSLAIAGYAFLVLRIGWRFYYGHPKPTPRQQAGAAYTLGKWTHLTMLAALALMLVTGPLMVWSSGNDIIVYDWFVLPGPLPTSFGLSDFFHRVHTWSAVVIFVGILLHLGGVYKHLAFNQDGTLTKIMIADKGAHDDETHETEVTVKHR
jgi:cytochrome b561